MFLLLVLASVQAANPAVGVDGTEVVKPEKKICRDMGSTGSRAKSSRVCKTKAEWDEMLAQSRKGGSDLTDEQRNQRLSGK